MKVLKSWAEQTPSVSAILCTACKDPKQCKVQCDARGGKKAWGVFERLVANPSL